MLKQVSCWISDECSKLDEDKSPKQQQTQHPPTRAPTRQATACQSLTPEPPSAGPTLHDRQLGGSARQRSASISAARGFLPSSHRSPRPPPPAGRAPPPVAVRLRPQNPTTPAASAAPRPAPWPPTAAHRYARRGPARLILVFFSLRLLVF